MSAKLPKSACFAIIDLIHAYVNVAKERAKMTNELIWNNDFNIGVDVIDNAHQKLFSIVQRIMKLVNENNNQQLACAEGIKFFKN